MTEVEGAGQVDYKLPEPDCVACEMYALPGHYAASSSVALEDGTDRFAPKLLEELPLFAG